MWDVKSICVVIFAPRSAWALGMLPFEGILGSVEPLASGGFGESRGGGRPLPKYQVRTGIGGAGGM